jgi:hypothetical protein
VKLKPQMMKLSPDTVTILKNFSNINQSILIRKGSKISTMSILKNIYAEANVGEDFPKEVAIYDLNEFLNGLGLHQDPDLDFANDSYISIKEGNRRVKYFCADPEVIVAPPDKEVNLPSKDVCFQLEHSQLDKLLKAAAVYKLQDLAVVGAAGVISLVVRDKNNDTSNEYSIIVGETDKEFTFNFKVENIKIIPGSYDVVISKVLHAEFTNTKYNMRYFIALEPDSTFE